MGFRPVDEWHEGFGSVMWWRLPVEEPPWVGTPLDDGWMPDYYTHWSPIIAPDAVTAEDISIASGAVEKLRAEGFVMYAEALGRVLQLVKGDAV